MFLVSCKEPQNTCRVPLVKAPVFQYTSAFADQAKLAAEEAKKAADEGKPIPGTTVALKSVFPVVSEAGSLGEKYVSFGGYLSCVNASLEGETLQERFRIEVDNIAFLEPSGFRKKARFSYGKRPRDNEDQDGAPSSLSPFVAGSQRT
ncbi:hypothetical protein B0H17DRAFT_1148095 [Mycena rosella]|uniref:Uncharacterized protein n=1 Tax=Mycena rosella TaxID=1033263 RepID=A0AAD7G0V6_MYCRO|nr:hypothetical protein B0H17DRAFT_1148095 [Mycena rosella]